MSVELEVTISKKQKKVPTPNSEMAAVEERLSCFDMLRNGIKNGKENISFLGGQKWQISIIDPEKVRYFLVIQCLVKLWYSFASDGVET